MKVLTHLKNGQVGQGFRLPWPLTGTRASLAVTEFPREPSWGVHASLVSRRFFLVSDHILSCCSFVFSCWVLGLPLLLSLLKGQAAPSWLVRGIRWGGMPSQYCPSCYRWNKS